MIYQDKVNKVQVLYSWRDIFLSLSGKPNFRSPERGVLLVPVKDAIRTFGLTGALELPGIWQS